MNVKVTVGGCHNKAKVEMEVDEDGLAVLMDLEEKVTRECEGYMYMPDIKVEVLR